LPPLLIVVFISALLAAAMSSADSSILATASVFGNNLLPHLPGGLRAKGTLWWTRCTIPISALISMLVALYVGEVYNLLLDSFSILLVGLFIPMTAGIWWPRANTPGGVVSMFSGTLAWIFFMWVTPELPADVIGWCVGLVMLIIVTLITSKTSPALPLTDANGNRIEYRGRLGTLSPFKKTSVI